MPEVPPIEVSVIEVSSADEVRPPMVASLSPSSMATWRQCPKRFFFEKILRIETDAGEPAVCGSFVHLVLQHLMDLPAAERTAEIARGIATRIWPAFITDPDSRFGQLGLGTEQATAFKRKAWAGITGYFRIEDPTEVDVLGTEQEVRADLDGAPVYGIIDRVDLGPDGLVVTDYKGLALDTPLPTPTGWTTMGEVGHGDLLLGADGRPTTVIGKSDVHRRPCYEIGLSGGSRIVCDDQHLWAVDVGPEAEPIRKVLRADELARLVDDGLDVRISNAEPLHVGGASPSDDPYHLGLRLAGGDGRPAETSATASRRVPAAYLRAGVRQRMALLRGLMDRGGGWDATRRCAVFTTTEPGVMEGLTELVHTLGWACLSPGTNERVPGGACSDMTTAFAPTTNPFRLPVKRALFRQPTSTDASHRAVRSVKPVATVPTACVTVDSASHLYLAGREMVPTHNSGKAPVWDDERDEKLGQLKTYAAMLDANGRRVSELRLLFVSPQLAAEAKADRCRLAADEAMALLRASVPEECGRVVREAVTEVEMATRRARESVSDRCTAKALGDEAASVSALAVARRLTGGSGGPTRDSSLVADDGLTPDCGWRTGRPGSRRSGARDERGADEGIGPDTPPADQLGGSGGPAEDVAALVLAAVVARRRAFFAERSAATCRPTTITLRVRDKDLELARSEASSIWAEASACYQSWEFPGRTGVLCGWCPFSDRCESFAAWDADGRPAAVAH